MSTSTLLATISSSMSSTVLGLLQRDVRRRLLAERRSSRCRIQPYINASIIIQLSDHRHPRAGASGQRGRRGGQEEDRLASPAMPPWRSALLQGFAYYMMLQELQHPRRSRRHLAGASSSSLTFVAGSALVMWLGEQITEFGIGNGISIILFVSIISRVPNAVIDACELHPHQRAPSATCGSRFCIVGMLAIVVLIVYRHRGRAPHPRPVRQASWSAARCTAARAPTFP